MAPGWKHRALQDMLDELQMRGVRWDDPLRLDWIAEGCPGKLIPQQLPDFDGTPVGYDALREVAQAERSNAAALEEAYEEIADLQRTVVERESALEEAIAEVDNLSDALEATENELAMYL